MTAATPTNELKIVEIALDDGHTVSRCEKVLMQKYSDGEWHPVPTEALTAQTPARPGHTPLPPPVG